MTLQEQTIMRNRPIVLCQVPIVIRSYPRKGKTAFLKLFQFPLKLERIQLSHLAADQCSQRLEERPGPRSTPPASITSTPPPSPLPPSMEFPMASVEVLENQLAKLNP